MVNRTLERHRLWFAFPKELQYKRVYWDGSPFIQISESKSPWKQIDYDALSLHHVLCLFCNTSGNTHGPGDERAYVTVLRDHYLNKAAPKSQIIMRKPRLGPEAVTLVLNYILQNEKHTQLISFIKTLFRVLCFQSSNKQSHCCLPDCIIRTTESFMFPETPKQFTASVQPWDHGYESVHLDLDFFNDFSRVLALESVFLAFFPTEGSLSAFRRAGLFALELGLHLAWLLQITVSFYVK